MFTGIIRHKGSLQSLEGKSISIACPDLLDRLSLGESVSVNGICLTVHDMHESGFSADLLDETLRVTNLGSLSAGTILNLEMPLRMGDTLGGHILSGHVDGTGTVSSKLWRNCGDCELTVTIEAGMNTYIVDRGSIAIDGVSLTIQRLQGSDVTVMLIPETLSATNLGDRESGDSVNIELDMMVKSVHRSVEIILAAREERNRKDEH